MHYTAQKLGTLENLGDIYQVAAPLDQQLLAFANVGIQTLAAPDEVAQIRLVGLSTDFSRTSIVPITIRGGNTILVRNSPLMNPLMASAAVKAHAIDQYFTTNKEVYEAAEALASSQTSLSPEKRSAMIVSQNTDFELTPEMDEARFLLRKHTQAYFERFTKGTIPFYNLSGDSKTQAIVNYLWFGDPQDDSELDCRGGYLSNVDRALGVFFDCGRSPHAKNCCSSRKRTLGLTAK